MSSAKERSEARRKALLNRGNDRLRKLTSSARGEDAPQFAHDDPPLTVPLKSFIGESTPEHNQSQVPIWSPDDLRRAMGSLGTTAAPFSLQQLPDNTSSAPVPTAPSSSYFKFSLLSTLLLPTIVFLYFSMLHESGIYKTYYEHVEMGHWSERWSRLGIRNSGPPTRIEGVRAVVREFERTNLTLSLICL